MLPGLSSFALQHQRQTGQLLFNRQRYGFLMEYQSLVHNKRMTKSHLSRIND